MAKYSNLPDFTDVTFDDPQETDNNNDTGTDFYYGHRGTMGEAVSLLGRGVISTLGLLENAAEFFNINDPLVDSAAKLRQFDLFKPDIDQYMGKGWLKETWAGSIPSAIESMGPSLAVAGAGFAAGLPFGGPIGGTVGAVLASLALMGTSEYQSTYESAIAQGLGEEEARTLATKNGLIEGLGESIGSWIGLGPLTKGLTRIAGQPLKATLNGLLKADAKAIGKDLLNIYGKEQLTEFAQAGGQVYNLREAGLTDQGLGEAMAKTIIPTMFMTGAFQMGTHSYSAKQRKGLRAALDGKMSPDKQAQAIDIIKSNLEQQDPEIAKAWDIYARTTVDKGNKINWNQDFAGFSDQITTAHTTPIDDAKIISGEGLTEAVNSALEVKPAPLDPVWEEAAEQYKDYQPGLPDSQADSMDKFKRAEMDRLVGEYLPDISTRQKNMLMDKMVSEYNAKLPIEQQKAFQDAIDALRPKQKAIPTEEEAQARADLLEAQGNVVGGATPSNEEMVKETGLREMGEFKESRKEKGKPDIREKTSLDWRFDKSQKTSKKGVYNGVIGTIPGVEDVEYAVIKTTGDKYFATRVRTIDGRKVSDKLQYVNEEEGTVDDLFPTRDAAIKGVNQDAADFIETEGAGAQWVGKKGQSRKATFNDNTYTVDKVGTVWKVLKNGEPFLNPNTPKGSWGKSLSKVLGTIEDIEGVEAASVVESPTVDKTETSEKKETTEEPEDKLKRLPTRGSWVDRFEGKPFTETLQSSFRNQLGILNNNLQNATEDTPAVKKARKDKAAIEAVLKWTPTGEPIQIKEAQKVERKAAPSEVIGVPRGEIGGEKFEGAPKEIEIEGKEFAQEKPAGNIVPRGYITDRQAEIERLRAEQEAEEARELTEDTVAPEAAVTPEVSSEELGVGIPNEEYEETPEKSALEIVQSAANEGDQLAKALLARVDSAVLEEIPVVNDESGRGSRYSIKDNIVYLRSNDSWVKQHEVIHSITARQMIGNPELTAEVETLMEDTRGFLQGEESDIEYVFSTPFEFLAQVQTNPALVEQMKAAGQGKLNLWQRFVEFVRRAIGLPQSRKALLDRALDLTVRLSAQEPAEAEGSLGAMHGVNSALANEKYLKKAIEWDKQGLDQRKILVRTGWFKLGDDKWRFYVPDASFSMTPDGELVLENIMTDVMNKPFDIITGEDGEFNTTKLTDFFNPGESAKGYPKLYENMSINLKWDDLDSSHGSYNEEDNIVNINIGAILEDIDNEELIGQEAMNELKEKIELVGIHEIQHAIQTKEKFARGGSILTNHIINQSLLLRAIEKHINEIGPNTADGSQQILDIINRDVLEGAAKEILIRNDGDLPPTVARVSAAHAVWQTILRDFSGALGDILDIQTKYTEEIGLRMNYSTGSPKTRETQRKINSILDLKTYAALLGEVEARMNEQLKREGVTKELFEWYIDPNKFAYGHAGNTEPIVILGSSGDFSVRSEKVDTAPTEKEQTPAERKTHLIQSQTKPVTSDSTMGKIWTQIKETNGKLFEGLERITAPVNDVLKFMSERYAAMNRIAEGIRSRNDKRDLVALDGLIKGLNSIPDEDKKVFKAGWINRKDRPFLEELIDKHGLRTEWNKWQGFLKNAEKEMVKWGVVSNEDLIEDYLPRIVKDPKALYNALQGEDLAIFEQQIRHQKAKVERAGGKWTPRMEEEFIAQIVSSNRYKSVPLPGFSKDRTIGHVPSEVLEHYKDPIETMIAHVMTVNEQLYQRSLAGKSNRAKKLQKLRNYERTMNKNEPSTEAYQDALKKSQVLAEEIYDVDEDARATLSQMVMRDKSLSSEEKQKVLELFNARFSQRGTHGLIHDVKNLSLIMTIGNPLSAITQLGDQGFNIADNGIYGIRGAAAALTGRDRLVNRFDIINAQKDFISDSKSSNTLTTMLKYSGLQMMDTYGKESYMQGAMRRFAKMDYNSFKEKMKAYEEFLPAEPGRDALGDAYLSMQEGKPNDNAALLLFAELSGVQPTTLSETSQGFLTGGNWRIMYMLKQFALRALSTSVLRMKEGFESGNPVKGILRGVSLIALLGLAGAGTDEIKNIILGREGEDLDDAIISNLMQILFINRYAVETGLSRGRLFENLIVNNIMLPPVKAADSLLRDILTTSQGDFSYKTMASVPMVGRIAFDYTPMGREAELKRQRQYILDKIAGGESPGKLRSDINKFNRQITGDLDVDRITSKTIKSARKRAREK